MTKFTPGQRVAAYHGTDRYTGKITEASEKRVIILLDTPTYAGVRGLAVHPKQCRKLVKKARRRVWIHREASLLGVLSNRPQRNTSDYFEFVEVRKRGKK